MSETIRQFLLKGEKEKNFLISDVAKHGCSGGTISELIYYDDTIKFHDKHEAEIWDEVNNEAGEYGYSSLEYIDLLKGGKEVSSITGLKNLLSWWACEVIARRIMDEREDDRQRIAEENANIQRVDAQTKGVKW
jgi:hypothetical protein